MKARSHRFWLLSLPLLAVAFVGLSWTSSNLLRGVRVDLTQNRLYTLSDGTRRILGRLQHPVTLELFYSERAAQSQPQFRVFAQRARELLEEVASRSKGKVTLVVTDPEPFTEEEDRATAAGLTGVPLGDSGDKLYFGLVARGAGDRQAAMPFLQPAKEAFLEYDLAKMISSLDREGKPVLALLTGLPMGPSIEPFTGRPVPGWVIDRQLGEFFDVRRLSPDTDSIGEDVDLLMVVHPRAVSGQTEAAIDQFVLGGGHLLVFVDPDAESDEGGTPSNSQQARGSTLPRLFKAWGVEFDPAQVVLDAQNAMRFQPDPQQPAVRHLAILGLHRQEMNQRDVVTAELEAVNLSTAGALSLAPDAPATLDALLQSSSAAALAPADAVRAAQADPAALADGFAPDSGAPYVLAARVGGRLPTAFPGIGGPGHLEKSKVPANVIIVADTDLLTDALWVQGQDFLGQQIYNPFANNADFIYNAADNLVGNDDLIKVRTRPTASRPFERIDAVRRRAEVRYQAKELQLQQQLGQLEQQLSQLQPITATGQPQALDSVQQAQLQRFQQQKAQTRRELRQVQRQLNADIQQIGNRIKLLDILAMPVLVLIGALLIAWRRHLRRMEAAG